MADSTGRMTFAAQRAAVLPVAADTDRLAGDAQCINSDDAPVTLGEWVNRAAAADGVLIKAGQLVPGWRKPGA